jgi:CDP-diglyceride synthetase
VYARVAGQLSRGTTRRVSDISKNAPSAQGLSHAGVALGTILARPLDGGMTLADGQPLFGHSKTIRGVVLSIVVTTLGAPSIGVDWTIGLVVAATAMIGDLFSSFTKRRMNLPPAAWPWAWIRPRSPSCQLSHVDGFCQSRSWISY